MLKFNKKTTIILLGSLIIFIFFVLFVIHMVNKKSNSSGKPGNDPSKPGNDPGKLGTLGIKNNKPLIECWAWNSLVTGGFMGYGIFANNTGGYTWDKNNQAVSELNTNTNIKWDDQIQNSQAITTSVTDIANKDCGSQFWDFISNKGSYKSDNNRNSLDGIKLQYDSVSKTSMDMSERYGILITNLINDGISHIGILIGGKPLDGGKAYHGVSLQQMLFQITNAHNFIVENKLGDNVYIALDIEPADSILDTTDLSGDYNWYKYTFKTLADHITKLGVDKPNVYYGMAINKNPYQSTIAYDSWVLLMKSQWTTKDGKDRGFRLIELMYWWTYVDTKLEIEDSHLYSQLLTNGGGVTSNPVMDALSYNCYLQFGIECTGEVDYLIFVPKNPVNTSGSECGTLQNPSHASCYKSQDGISYVENNIGYRCVSHSQDSTKFYNYETPNTSDQYYNLMKFTGKQADYHIVYGYPFIPYCGKSKKYNLQQCNALGSCKKPTDPNTEDPIGISQKPTTISSAINFNSCTFLNKESWLLGGGLSDKSLEEYLHSDEALKWIKSIVNKIGGSSASNRIFMVPFCVEDFTGYSGWLHNFKYGSNSKKQKTDIQDFPDITITAKNANGKICQSNITVGSDGKIDILDGTAYSDGYQRNNIACLGQTTLSIKNNKINTDWTAGTLEYKNNKWSCPNEKYFSLGK